MGALMGVPEIFPPQNLGETLCFPKIFHPGIGPKISPLQVWIKFFVRRLGESLLERKVVYDEEKDTINRSGMEVALGVYQDRQ